MKNEHTIRKNVFGYQGILPKIDDSVFLAPTATMIGDVTIEKEASIWYGCVLRGDMAPITIGEGTSIQDLVVCHTDLDLPLSVGSGVTVGHRCILHGCTIEDDCLIGMGSIIMNGAVIGRGSIIAAGTTVLERSVIPPFSLVAGLPGKIKRTFLETEVLPKIAKAAQNYRNLAAAYLSED